MWKIFFKEIKSSLRSLCFPSFCVSCKESIENEGLCSVCTEGIQLIDIKTRCLYCFQEKAGVECRADHNFYSASCCESFGPILPMIFTLDATDFLRQKNIGSLMTVQLCLLGWPLPDLLIPFSSKDRIALGIAKQISCFIEAKVCVCLKEHIFTKNETAPYFVGKGANLSDKNCLIVSLKKLSNEEKNALFECLQEADPKGVFFLSFAE